MNKIQMTQLTRQVRLALVAGTAAMLAHGTLLAAAADDAQTQTPAAQQGAGQATTDNAAMQLGNVTVTAQSRTQQVQEVPIAMQVISSTQIDTLAATDLSKMDKYVPGLSVSGDQPTQPNFSLRGIGTGDFGIGTDAPVGVYANGVYQGKTGGALLMFNDIDHVEVLKGPQGTLFGRNSAAGAISVTTMAPSDQFEANARLRLGNYGLRYGDGVLNTPLGENLAFRLSFVDNQSDGWLRDSATGRHFYKDDDWGTRMQLHWNAPGDTAVNLAWEHERLKQPPRATIGVSPVPAYPELPSTTPDYSTFLDPRNAPLYNEAIGARESRTYDSFVLRAEHALPFGDFTSLTSFQRYHTYNREAQEGMVGLLALAAALSANLGFVNLLPIPVLDGGHLMYHIFEVVRGRPLSERAMEITQRFTIRYMLGLHARAAAAFVKVANRYQSDISVKKDSVSVNGKSIMGVLMLAAAKGSEIDISARGDDADDAIGALAKLIDDKFGEE